jgi:hypothetical protein
MFFDHGNIPKHARKRLRGAFLPFPKPLHGALIIDAAREMISSEALDCDDETSLEQLRGAADSIAGYLVPPCINELECGSALGARDRFRMEAPVTGIGVLRPAEGVHRELFHRRERPVVREPFDYCEPRSAIGAINERIPIALVRGIPHLRETIGAGGGIDGEKGLGRAGRLAGYDLEVALPDRLYLVRLKMIDSRERRKISREVVQKRAERLDPAFNLDDDPRSRILDPSSQPCVLREPVHARTESDPLHTPIHEQAQARRIVSQSKCLEDIIGIHGCFTDFIAGRLCSFSLYPLHQAK